jgi:hypothetical protein
MGRTWSRLEGREVQGLEARVAHQLGGVRSANPARSNNFDALAGLLHEILQLVVPERGLGRAAGCQHTANALLDEDF